MPHTYQTAADAQPFALRGPSGLTTATLCGSEQADPGNARKVLTSHRPLGVIVFAQNSSPRDAGPLLKGQVFADTSRKAEAAVHQGVEGLAKHGIFVYNA